MYCTICIRTQQPLWGRGGHAQSALSNVEAGIPSVIYLTIFTFLHVELKLFFKRIFNGLRQGQYWVQYPQRMKREWKEKTVRSKRRRTKQNWTAHYMKMKNEITKQGRLLQKKGYNAVCLSTEQKSPAPNRIQCSAGKEQRYCQTNFILTLLQRLNLLSLSITASLGGPVGYLLLKLPASPLPQRSAHAMSRLCQYRVGYTYSIARWQIVFYWAWNPLTGQRKWRGVEGGRLRERWKDEKDRKVLGAGEKVRDGEKERAIWRCVDRQLA